jgi:hypothetical protein
MEKVGEVDKNSVLEKSDPEDVLVVLEDKDQDVEDLKKIESKNKEDLERYEQIIPEPSYPTVSYSIDKLCDLTNGFWEDEDFTKIDAKEYFLSNPISENFTIPKIKFELKNYKRFNERICNYWDVMDNHRYSFIQKQIFESFFKEYFSTDDYKIENQAVDFNTYESEGLNHASFFNKSLQLKTLDLNDVRVNKILEDLKNKSENFKNNPYEYSCLLDFYIETDKSFKEKLVSDIENCLVNSNFDDLPSWGFIGKSAEMSLVFKDQLSDLLNKYGLNDSEKFFNSWIEADYQSDGGCIKKNLKHLVSLEHQKPGAAKNLYEKNGVTRFDRMSPEFWLKQVEIGDPQGDFGMFIVSRHDHNNAFESSNVGPNLEKAYGDLEDNGYTTRYIEVANKIDLAKKLLKQEIVLENGNKIKYAIVFAHGSPDGIALTQNFDEESLNQVSASSFKTSNDIKYIDKSDFEGAGFKKAKRFFVEDPTVDFISCSVGAPDGFAQSFSKTYNSNSVAADKSIRLKNISVAFKNNKPVFDIEYLGLEGTSKNTISNGKIVNQAEVASDIE